ncbi:hypothetical protein ACH0AK_14895 [Enterococcus pernyi]
MTYFKIKVVGGSPYLNFPDLLEFSCSDFEEFKVKFLKRFGNIRGTNKAEKERVKIKQGIYETRNIMEFKNVFFLSSHWHIEMYYRRER